MLDRNASKILQRLPAKFQEVPAYEQLALAIEELLADKIWGPRDALARIRDPKTLEKVFLSLTASMLGFKIDGDWMDDLSYVRVTESLAEYYSTKGTQDFYKFMGFLVDTQFTLNALWTEDYVSFYTAPKGPLAYAGGTWYLSPHVDLLYDSDLYDPTNKDLAKLFYFMAPIHLVLEQIIQVIYSDLPVDMSMGARVTDYVIGGDFLPIKVMLGAQIIDYVE